MIIHILDGICCLDWVRVTQQKATLTRRECIEIIRKDGSYARNIFSYVYKSVDITVGNIQEKADSIFWNCI